MPDIAMQLARSYRGHSGFRFDAESCDVPDVILYAFNQNYMTSRSISCVLSAPSFVALQQDCLDALACVFTVMLAQPLMQGSGKFWHACEYMESQGFELLHVKPIQSPGHPGRSKSPLHTYLNECDAVFALRPDVADELTVEYRIGLLAFYLTNLFYEEALSLLERDAEMVDYLRTQGCRVEALIDNLITVV
jgi:hypothetical protein